MKAPSQGKELAAHGSLTSLRLTDQPGEFIVLRASTEKRLTERNVYIRP